MPRGWPVMLLVAVVIGVPLGALMIRGGVALYHKMRGGKDGPHAVPEPDFAHALAIAMIDVVAQLVVGFVLALAAGATFGRARTAEGATRIASIPAGVLVLAAVLKYRLPTSFDRAMRVSLCVLLIGVLVGVGVAGLVVAIGSLAR